MPEFAEVAFYCQRWHRAALGERIVAVRTHDRARVFRGASAGAIRRALTGARFESSATAAKQMLFRFSGEVWLGIHLGMSGELRDEPAGYAPQKHDHLVLVTARRTLVHSDPRMFGRIDFHLGPAAPAWWTKIAPPILGPTFTPSAVAAFLRRRGRAPIKAVLLMQERFPGIGNWMADEVLWRAAIHPRRPAGSLTEREVRALWRECRQVCRLALAAMIGRGPRLPPDLNGNIPRTWLFRHRWEDGGRCPRTGALLQRAVIGGRMTCWSPARQLP